MTTITLSGKVSDRFPTYCLAAVRDTEGNKAAEQATMVECCLDDDKDRECKRLLLKYSGYTCCTPVMVIHGHNDAIVVDYVSECGELGWCNRNEVLFGQKFIQAAKRINADMLAEDNACPVDGVAVLCPKCGHTLHVKCSKCVSS